MSRRRSCRNSPSARGVCASANGMQSDAEMGPIISQAALERIRGYIEDGVASGAQLVVDGRRHR